MTESHVVVETHDDALTSREGYVFELSSASWRLSRDENLSLRWARATLTADLRRTLSRVLAYYAVHYSASYTRNIGDKFAKFFRWVHLTRGKPSRVHATDLINYRAFLSDSREWQLAFLGGAFRKWLDLGLLGLDESVRELLDSWSFKAQPKGDAVRVQCPMRGALTDIEYEALQNALLDAFDKNELELDLFALALLFMATGRRPCQLGDVKQKDFLAISSDEGLQEYILKVPRRKQQGTTWRTQFKPVALSPEIGQVVQSLIWKNERHLTQLIPDLSKDDLEVFPIFARWREVKKEATKGIENFRRVLASEALHRTTVRLRHDLNRAISGVTPVSERTGQPLHLFPTRLRRTLATRAAREGYGVLVIAELLDHNDTQNAVVYTENVPEHVNAINAAVAMQLAPLAQAFCGVLVDKESDAIRGDDLASRVRTVEGMPAGTCGHFGFCGGLAPIACYTCRHFQPWLDGPHHEVLEDLVAERDRIASLTRDITITTINDRTILAVGEVVRRCEVRNAELQRTTSDA